MKDSFVKIGWVYMPLNAIGWLITILTMLSSAWVFYIIDRHSHSVSDTFSNFFPYGVSFFTVRHWIASNTCINRNNN